MENTKSSAELNSMKKDALVEYALELQNAPILNADEKDTLISTLKTELKAAKSENESLISEVSESKEFIEELNKQLNASESAQTKADLTVEFEGESYKVKPGKFNYNGTIVSFAVLQSDRKLLAELIQMEAGFITKI